MRDPFGTRAFLHGERYHAPNRAFAHWTMSLYFKTVPFAFQLISSPLNSIYLSAALAKLLFQILICFTDSHASGHNKSEKRAIQEIAASPKHTVLIYDYCTIMAYRPITDSLESSLNTQLLKYWGVLDRDKLYYQEY